MALLQHPDHRSFTSFPEKLSDGNTGLSEAIDAKNSLSLSLSEAQIADNSSAEISGGGGDNRLKYLHKRR